MKTATPQAEKPEFQKTDVPCLYRYSSNGVYYALVKHEGKQKRASLETTDKAEAKRKLADFQRDLGKVDTSQGRITLRELCAKYLATVQNQAEATVYRKEHIVERLLADFPRGADCQIGKIKQSDLEAWLAGYEFGPASHLLYLLLLRALFNMAVNDKLISESPAAKIRPLKAVKPIRITPSFDDFQAIIADVRKQKFNADAEESADFLEFLGLIGVGQAEAGGIQRQHVNVGKKQLTFFRHKTKTPYTVPIYPQAEALVAKLIRKPDMKQDDTLFQIKDAKKALAAACDRLKFPAYSQRAFRRMFITRCIELGVDVKVIAKWQGHQDGGKLILGTYSHVRNEHAEEMAKKLATEHPAAPNPGKSEPRRRVNLVPKPL